MLLCRMFDILTESLGKLLFTHIYCIVNYNMFTHILYSHYIALWIIIAIHNEILLFFFFNFCYYCCFKFCFCLFYFLISRWLRIEFRNLFLFILPFYRVKVVYGFARVTQVASVYGFDVMSFFLIELDFVIVYFFLI